MRRFICLIICLLPLKIWGHAGLHEAPSAGSLSPTDYGPYSSPTSHAGYGYLASSEAQARDAFDFSCSDSNVATLIRRACEDIEGFPTQSSNRDLISNLADGPFRAYLQRMLRRQVYEHSALQRFSTSGGNGRSIDPPDPGCLDESDTKASPIMDILDLRGPNSSPRSMQINDGRAPTVEELKSLHPPMSVAAVSRLATSFDQVSNESLVTGIVTAGYFNRALFCLCDSAGAAAGDCSTIRSYNGIHDATTVLIDSSTQCRSLRHTLFRVKQAYPGIFQEISDNSTSLNSFATAALVNMAGMLGGSSTERGMKRLLEDTGTNPRGPSGIIRDVLQRMRITEGTGPIRSNLQSIRNQQHTQSGNIATLLCDSTLNELILDNPQAVRQMLIDAGSRSEDERDILRSALCQIPEFRTLKGRHCLTKYPIRQMIDPSDGEEYDVVQGLNMSDYPFGSNVNYRMRRYRVGSQWRAKVKLRLNMVVQPQATLTSAQLETWRTQTQEFYNNQARQNGRNIEFEFEFTQGSFASDAININYHTCWCSTCSPSMSPPNQTPPERNVCVDGRMSQADAGNFPSTVDLPTIQHEIGHGLGLPDEYSADYYNFNTIGEADSLMNGNGRLYNRHFNRMMEPNECY